VNVNPIVITALAPLGLPVSPNVYTGTATDYITFNYADERPEVYADDTDILDSTTIQVHYFEKKKTAPDVPHIQTRKKEIRKALRSAGFSIQSTQELYESDTGYTHVVVYAWIDGAIND
jgi:hypothetical protein